MNQYTAYIINLREHIENVQEACKQLNVHIEQAAIHDQSKFSPEEFEQYANNFWNSDGTQKKPEQRSPLSIYNFTIAWSHHIHHNPHHWQHWIFSDGYAPESMVTRGYITKDGAMVMPSKFATEMIADWMGASKTYTGSWDMSDWLKKNMKRIVLHPYTAEDVRQTLSLLDTKYSKLVETCSFKNELKDE